MPWREIAEAYLPVANGAATKREVENAVRASLRGAWIEEDRHASLQISDSVAREAALESARPGTWAAVSALTQRQRAVVVLSFWYGLSQGVSQAAHSAGWRVVVVDLARVSSPDVCTDLHSSSDERTPYLSCFLSGEKTALRRFYFRFYF
jgi:hypothetical protein